VVIGRNSAYDLHLSRWHFQTRWTMEMSMGAFKVAMDVYISYKFSKLLSGTSAVTAGINQISVFCYYSLWGETAMPGGLYASLCHAFLLVTIFAHKLRYQLPTQ